jgi:gamma-D-glutamyl-L-lysine dipeptidyl-peptidase
MVTPYIALAQRDIVDVRAEPRHDAELVDQAHFGENFTLLGERDDWRYVQGPDQYFGWVAAGDVAVMTGTAERYEVAVLLGDVRVAPRRDAQVIARLPVGTHIPPVQAFIDDGRTGSRETLYHHPEGWREFTLTETPARKGFISLADVVDLRRLPRRYPTAEDYLKTAESFIGAPYLWGGTTALGLDCSGFVQQVYRLNGVALPRDADQQALLGRRVDEARAGDLMFFGAESVTHVALATSASEFIHAPMTGGVVEHGRLGGDRKLRGIRRYLPDVSTA